MILISAMTEDRVIGAGEGMPWDIPAEYQQFLDFVAGQTIIMGRRSFEIFGDDLTTEHTIVLSRSDSVEGDVEVVENLDEALGRAKSYGKTIFCGGGASVYEQALPLAEAMYLSYIKQQYEGDAHFPEFDPSDWRIVEQRDHPWFRFVHYARKNAPAGGR